MSGAVFAGITNQNDWRAGSPVFVGKLSWLAGTTPNSPIITVPGRARILCAVGRLEALESGPATIGLYKAIPGQALSAGTLVCSTLLQCGLGATLYQPQFLTQWGTVESLDVGAGDTFGAVAAGSFSASSGSLTVYFAPR